MYSNLDIIMLALPRWDGAYSSTAFSLAKEFSRNNRVFYIDNPFTIKDYLFGYFTDKVRKRSKALLTGKNIYTRINENNLIAVTPRLTIPINFLPQGFFYDALSGYNDRIFFAAIKAIIEDHGVKDFIFINSFNPFYGRKFPAFFNPRLFIYHSVDDISQSRYVHRHGPRLEAEAMKRADLTFTTSKELKRIRSTEANNIYYLPNAADISLFKRCINEQFKRPAEIEGITAPIIIYTGHIDLRLDYDLIKAISRNHPDKVLLMVGPLTIKKTLHEELMSLPNVIFTGRKKLEELPQYLYHSQCAIIPFKCNVLTRSIYPLKVNEYLAAGKPVISTAFSDDIVDFNEVAYISETIDDFCRNINRALQEDSPERIASRVNEAEKNDWESRVDTFWKVTSKYLEPAEVSQVNGTLS